MNKLASLPAWCRWPRASPTPRTSRRRSTTWPATSQKMMDMLAKGGGGAGAAAQPQRPQRPEPDRAKTYAVPIDGDGVAGPADAKVTWSRRTTTRARTASASATTMDELHKKYGNDVRIVYKQMVVHPHERDAPARSRSAPPTKQGKGVADGRACSGTRASRAASSTTTDVPAAEAGAPGEEVLGERGRLPDRARLRAGARAQRRQVQGRHEGRVPAARRRRTCASSRCSASAPRRRSSSTAGSSRARCRSTTSARSSTRS